MAAEVSLRPVPSRASDKHFRWWWLLLACLAMLMVGLGSYGLLDPDEGRYASIAQQMLLHGDFVTPAQNGFKFFDKPPLLHWTIAASYRLFGISEWAARLVPALAALAGIGGAVGLGRRMFGVQAGCLAGVILSTSLLWAILARFVITDMLFSSLVFIALALWWLGYSETEATPHGQRRIRGYFLAFWVALAAAVLAKGPVALVLTGGTIWCYALMLRRRPSPDLKWRSGFSVPGILLFLAIAAPWFVLVAARNPEFNAYFWGDQHIGRFLGHTTGNDHRQPAIYYLLLMPVVFFPWSFLAPVALVAAWRQRQQRGWDARNPRQRATLFLVCAMGFITLFFSAASGKILTYILPIVPFGALALAQEFEVMLARGETWSRALGSGVAALCVLLAALGLAVLQLAPRKLEQVAVNPALAVFAGTLLLAWAVVVAVSSWRYRLAGTIAGTAGGFIAVFCTMVAVTAHIAPRYSTASLLNVIRPALTPQSRIITLGVIQSVAFYAGRRVQVIGSNDELSLGVRELSPTERQRWVVNGSTAEKTSYLLHELARKTPVYCVLQSSQRAETQHLIKTLNGMATIIVRNERYAIVGNSAARALIQ